MLEFPGEFDHFIAQHLEKYGNIGSSLTSYLSKTTYEEFIEIMADKVISVIIKEIKTVKYYSITVDYTPGISRIDHISFIFRYV